MDGAFSCVAMLEPLLLTQALADAGSECQPNPDPGVAYIESACKISGSRFLLFFFFQIQPWFGLYTGIRTAPPSAASHHVSRGIAPLSAQACERLLSI